MAELVLKGVESEEELCLANELMAKVHYLDAFEGLQWLRSCGAGYPEFSPEHTRIALFRGELAGALRLTTHTIRVGEARLKMGGFGWVTTAGPYRNKGVAVALISDTMRYMRGQRYHVSMLFGIPNFYHRFGFASSLAEYACVVQAREALEAPDPHWRMRRGKPRDIRAIAKLHDACDGGVACSVVRSGAHLTNGWEQWRHVRVITDTKGKVRAYFLAQVHQEELNVVETGLSGRQDCAALLRAAAKVAGEARVGRIRFHGPPGHPLQQYLLQYKTTHEMNLTRVDGGMMAIVNLDEALESMIPEWESRLLCSVARDYRTECTLLVDRKPYCLRAHRGSIAISLGFGKNKLSLSQAELLHLLTGYRYLGEILSVHRRAIDAQGRALLRAIFPKRAPYVWHPDRF